MLACFLATYTSLLLSQLYNLSIFIAILDSPAPSPASIPNRLPQTPPPIKPFLPHTHTHPQPSYASRLYWPIYAILLSAVPISA